MKKYSPVVHKNKTIFTYMFTFLLSHISFYIFKTILFANSIFKSESFSYRPVPNSHL